MTTTAIALEHALMTLNPSHLDIQDDSALHAGHAGNTRDGSHFTVTIVCEQFENKSLLQRHRLVNEACRGLLASQIHALSIQAKTPAEWPPSA
jgi:BolA protein